MTIVEIKERIYSWDKFLIPRQKKYIHYKSMRNFAFHFEGLPNDSIKGIMKVLLSDYIREVENNDFDYESKSGYHLAVKYLREASDYYTDFVNFSTKIKVIEVIAWGGSIDVVLYTLGLLSKLLFIPVTTTGLFVYYFYVLLFKERKKLVCGIFY